MIHAPSLITLRNQAIISDPSNSSLFLSEPETQKQSQASLHHRDFTHNRHFSLLYSPGCVTTGYSSGFLTILTHDSSIVVLSFLTNMQLPSDFDLKTRLNNLTFENMSLFLKEQVQKLSEESVNTDRSFGAFLFYQNFGFLCLISYIASIDALIRTGNSRKILPLSSRQFPKKVECVFFRSFSRTTHFYLCIRLNRDLLPDKFLLEKTSRLTEQAAHTALYKIIKQNRENDWDDSKNGLKKMLKHLLLSNPTLSTDYLSSRVDLTDLQPTLWQYNVQTYNCESFVRIICLNFPEGLVLFMLDGINQANIPQQLENTCRDFYRRFLKETLGIQDYTDRSNAIFAQFRKFATLCDRLLQQPCLQDLAKNGATITSFFCDYHGFIYTASGGHESVISYESGVGAISLVKPQRDRFSITKPSTSPAITAPLQNYFSKDKVAQKIFKRAVSRPTQQTIPLRVVGFSKELQKSSSSFISLKDPIPKMSLWRFTQDHSFLIVGSHTTALSPFKIDQIMRSMSRNILGNRVEAIAAHLKRGGANYKSFILIEAQRVYS